MPAGQPPKFKTVKEMQSAIDEYFEYCDNRIRKVYKHKLGAVVEMIDPEPYTIEGLCLTLNMSRQSLLNYEKTPGYEKFFDTVKKAKMKVQKDIVLRSMEGNAAGPIFNLKNNFQYADKTEVDQTINTPTGIKIKFVDN